MNSIPRCAPCSTFNNLYACGQFAESPHAPISPLVEWDDSALLMTLKGELNEIVPNPTFSREWVIPTNMLHLTCWLNVHLSPTGTSPPSLLPYCPNYRKRGSWLEGQQDRWDHTLNGWVGAEWQGTLHREVSHISQVSAGVGSFDRQEGTRQSPIPADLGHWGQTEMQGNNPSPFPVVLQLENKEEAIQILIYLVLSVTGETRNKTIETPRV